MSKANKTYLIYAGLGLITIFLYALPQPDPKGTFTQGLVNIFPYPLYMGFALVGFLGLKLNQNRILFSALIYLCVCYLLINPLTLNSIGISLYGLYYMIGMSFPLTLAIMFSSRGARPLDLPNIGKLSFSLFPMILFGYFLARDKPVFSKIAFLKIIPGLTPNNNFFLPQFALFALAALGLVIYFQRDRIKPFIKVLGLSMIPLMGTIWVVLKLFHGFLKEHSKFKLAELQEWVATTFPSIQVIAAFTVICGILLHAVFQMYWHRVYVDELTDVPNRRALDECLSGLSGEYAIAMMDIDHFKSFNDNYGHDEGDNVLRLVGSVLSNELGDRIFRYGGEEFCAVFKGVSAEDAYMFANKVRRKLEERDFYIRKPNSKREPTSAFDRRKTKKSSNGKKVQITISIGLANPNKKSKTVEDVLKLADQALYQAKRKGRNRVVIWENESVKSAV